MAPRECLLCSRAWHLARRQRAVDVLKRETLVRLHRAGEGAPYTGIKDEPVEPIMAMADKALVDGSADEMIKKISGHMEEAVRERFRKVVEARKDTETEYPTPWVFASLSLGSQLRWPSLPSSKGESGMTTRIPYVDPASITDPEVLGYLDLARREGTPRPESQAIRAHNPAVIRAFSQAWDLTFRHGVCDHRIKELCRVYVSKAIDCAYCGVQRSVQAGRKGLSEDQYDELLTFSTSSRFTEREKVALTYTSAIIWNSEIADDPLWVKLHEHFTVPELVELGFFIALTLGQQRWIKTLGIEHRAILGDTTAGLAPAAVPNQAKPT